MLQILCKTPAAIFKIQIPANTKSKSTVLRGVVQTDDQHYVLSPPANGDK